MPIYRPTNIYPNFDTIDGTKDCDFTWQFKGTNCEGHKIDIYNADGTVKQAGSKITYPTPLQNNDIATHTIPAGTMAPNGKTFGWGLTLYGDKYDTLVASIGGERASETEIKLNYSYYEQIKVGMKVMAKPTNSSTWKDCGAITSKSIIYDWNFYIATAIVPPETYRLDVKIYNNDFRITPNFVVYTADESQVSIDSIPSLNAIKTPTQTFTATYNQPNDIPLFRYRWELYRGDVKMDETDYLTSNNIEYTYKGFVSGQIYTVKLILEDKLGRIATDEKTYIVDYTENPFWEPIIVQKGYRADSCVEAGCIEIDWSSWGDSSLILTHDKMVVLREENGDGIFKFMTELDANPDNMFLRDYNIKSGVSYRYRVVWYISNRDPIADPYPIYVGMSPIINYQTNFLFVIGIDDLGSSREGAYTVSPNNVWAFRLNVENSPQTQNEHVTIYSTLSQFPRVSKGEGNYVSGDISCLIGNVVQLGSYSEPKNIVTKWREFCNDSTVKLVRDRSGSAMLCALTNNTSQSDEYISSVVNNISFTYTEIMKNKSPIVGE